MKVRVQARTGAVREVRHQVARWAVANGALSDAERALTLLTSEVVTNAVEHGPHGGMITVEAEREEHGFRVGVTDDSPQHPVVRPRAENQVRGRGMQLVSLLASEWGVDDDHGRGKRVWFIVGG
ncbi:MAG TPA: ATP-binding protein [Actinotalea sp.]